MARYTIELLMREQGRHGATGRRRRTTVATRPRPVVDLLNRQYTAIQ